jgi:hypothetical protein
VDAGVGGEVLGFDFEGEAAKRAAVAAAGGLEAVAIAGEDGEDAADGIWAAGEGGADDGGLEAFEVAIEDGEQERFLAFEEMIEAAAVDAGALEDLGHAGGGVAFFPEEISGGFEDTLAGGGGGHE